MLAQTLPSDFTPVSRYYAMRTGGFCKEIQKRGVKLLNIDTEEKLSDIFTKGLHCPQFEYFRKILVG